MSKVTDTSYPVSTAITIGTDKLIGTQGGVVKRFNALGFVPDQTNYVGTMFIGNGGANINNTGTDAGDFNTYIGIGSGLATTIAKKNTALGTNALAATTSGWSNTAVGYNALAVGVGTGSLNIGGAGVEFYANTAIGESSGLAMTTGSYNTFVGCNSGTKLTTGIENCFFGVHAGQETTIGNANLFIGKSTGYFNVDGDYNIAIGGGAGAAAVSLDGQIAIGYNALAVNVTGANCIAIGMSSQVANTNGASHVSIGYQSLYSTNYDAGCTAVGYQAGYLTAVNSNYNSYFGFCAGRTITTGAVSNTFIGANAGYHGSQLATADNSTAIGADTYTTKSNQVVIGNSSITEMKLAGRLIMTQISASITDGTPSDAELDTATGLTPSTAGAGWACTVLDSGGSGLLYRVESDGTNWQYWVAAKAT
jgi:hypothetical protein